MNRLQERLDARNYQSDVSKDEFSRGYRHGFNREHRRTLSDDPNAYNAGYWEGHGDQKELRKMSKEQVEALESVTDITRRAKAMQLGLAKYPVADVISVLDETRTKGRRLLDSLPPHWHDDQVVEFRDFIEALEREHAK